MVSKIATIFLILTVSISISVTEVYTQEKKAISCSGKPIPVAGQPRIPEGERLQFDVTVTIDFAKQIVSITYQDINEVDKFENLHASGDERIHGAHRDYVQIYPTWIGFGRHFDDGSRTFDYMLNRYSGVMKEDTTSTKDYRTRLV